MTEIPQSDLPIPPGEYLLEVISEIGLDIEESATFLDIQSFRDLAKGKIEITDDLAQRIEDLCGVPTHIWIGLEREFRQLLATSNCLRSFMSKRPKLL